MKKEMVFRNHADVSQSQFMKAVKTIFGNDDILKIHIAKNGGFAIIVWDGICVVRWVGMDAFDFIDMPTVDYLEIETMC